MLSVDFIIELILYSLTFTDVVEYFDLLSFRLLDRSGFVLFCSEEIQ